MKKLWTVLMLAALTCLPMTAAMAAEAPTDAIVAETVTTETEPATPEAPQATQEEVLPELPFAPFQSLMAPEAQETSSGGITCTFNCNDGIGYVYDCPLSGLGACCGQAAPACSQNGGLASGICRQGRLGLPCIPL